jgi:hypothetical protein
MSEDPSIIFNGNVNDLTTNTHTLLVAAIAPDNSNASSAAASVNYGSSVGNVSPLYSLNTQVIVNQNQTNAIQSYVGSINIVGNVATYSDQTYRANVMTARATTQPGGVTFSIYDPSSTISYLLPLQTSGAGAGQMNLQNPNSLDTLTINGVNNYASVQNQNGLNNWGKPATISNALGYVYLPPIPSTSPSISPVIQDLANFIINSSAQNSQPVSVTTAAPISSPDSQARFGDMVAHSSDASIPKPDEGMLNVLIKVNLSGQDLILSRSASVKDFKFTIPAELLPSSIVSTVTSSELMSERAVLADGGPLPSWIQYDPETNTFIAKQVPATEKAIIVKIQAIKDGKVLEESPEIVIDAK